MGKALLIIIGVVLFVYALFDLIATPSREARYLPKPFWFIVLLAVPVGPLLWIFFGVGSHPSPPGNPQDWRHPSTRGPDDDPDYLRGL